MGNVEEFLPFGPGERVQVNIKGDPHDGQIGRVRVINLKTGEVAVLLNCGEQKIYHIDDLEALA